MLSFLTFALPLLALTTAAPTSNLNILADRATTGSVQVQFANEVTGANGNALIPLDNSAVNLGTAYGNTNLEKDGKLFVTSLQFTANFQGVACDVLKDEVTNVAHIANPQQDYSRFSQAPVDWQTGFAIHCRVVS